VIISYGNYGYAGPQIVQSGSGGAFLSSTDELFDGQPSTVTRFTWTGGAQTTASFTGIEFFLTPSPVDTTPATLDFAVVAIKNTSLPAGMKVQLRLGTTIGTVVATGNLETDPAGGTSIWLVYYANISNTGVALVLLFYNDVGGTHPMHAADEVTVGEIHVGLRSDWFLKRNQKITSANVGKLNLSAAGVQFPGWSPRVRQNHFELAPMGQKEALASDDGEQIDFETLIANIMNSDVVGFIPEVTPDPALYGGGTSYSSETQQDAYRIRARTAYLGNFLQAPTTSGNNDKYYLCTMDVQESR
jgi:hypothetical protein